MTIENLKELKRSIRRYYEGPAAVHYLGVMARINKFEANVRKKIDKLKQNNKVIQNPLKKIEKQDSANFGELLLFILLQSMECRNDGGIVELKRILGEAESAGRGVARCGGESQVGRVRNDFATLAQPPQNKEAGSEPKRVAQGASSRSALGGCLAKNPSGHAGQPGQLQGE